MCGRRAGTHGRGEGGQPMSRAAVTRRRFLTLTTAGIALAPSWSHATPGPRGRAPALIPRQVLFGDPDKGWARISPDGTRLAFLAPFNGVLNLWVAPLRDIAKARPFTRVSDRSLGPWLTWM